MDSGLWFNLKMRGFAVVCTLNLLSNQIHKAPVEVWAPLRPIRLLHISPPGPFG